MKILNLSGASTNIGFLFGVSESLITRKNQQFDVISGISSGAILSLPLALGKFNEVRELVLNYDLDTFFRVKPVNKKGRLTLRGIWRAIKGESSLGDQSKLLEVIKTYNLWDTLL